jgi:hypothetical protein
MGKYAIQVWLPSIWNKLLGDTSGLFGKFTNPQWPSIYQGLSML